MRAWPLPSAVMALGAEPGPARSSGKRARIVAVFMGAVFGVIATKGAALSLAGALSHAGETTVPLADGGQRRADIVDRNGELLATTVDGYSLFADPRAIWNPAETAHALATVFDDLDRERLTARLADRDRAFVWVHRHLTPKQHQAVFALGLEGIGFRKEARRAYPSGALAGHLLGHTGVDGMGLSGIEYLANDALTNAQDPVRLTLDAGVQFVLERELEAAAIEQSAIGGAGIIIDVTSGELLAIASWPAFNPNLARTYGADDTARFNRAVTGVYELGSVFKPLTVAAALDADAISPTQAFSTEGPITIGDATIEDLHPVTSPASVTTILAESSNLGTVRIAGAMGASAHWDALDRFGLLGRPDGDIPALATPLLPENWSDLTKATVSYGHGIAVSPLSVAWAYATLANDGVRIPMTIIATDSDTATPDADRVRVVSKSTSEAVIEMLRIAVLDGTGKAADRLGYRVAGKTGTAEKPVNGVYDPDRNLNSFAAVFPADRPEYAILVMLDEAKPQQGAEGMTVGDTAASTAAPLAGRVIERAAPLLGVLPHWDAPTAQPSDERRHSG